MSDAAIAMLKSIAAKRAMVSVAEGILPASLDGWSLPTTDRLLRIDVGDDLLPIYVRTRVLDAGNDTIVSPAVSDAGGWVQRDDENSLRIFPAVSGATEDLAYRSAIISAAMPCILDELTTMQKPLVGAYL